MMYLLYCTLPYHMYHDSETAKIVVQLYLLAAPSLILAAHTGSVRCTKVGAFGSTGNDMRIRFVP